MAKMHYETIYASDDCKLAFQTSLSEGTRPETCIVLLHGFSGSSEYFTRNFDALAARHWVVAPDMRGHGRSGRPAGGYHLGRLAADLRDLLLHLQEQSGPDVLLVGCSIGAAILWTYVEIFGIEGVDDGLLGFVFVDQAPLQNRSEIGGWDASKAHFGCYDAATTAAAQDAWVNNTKATHKALLDECLGYRHQPEATDDVSEARKASDAALFTRISAQCDPQWLARLIADHTAYDHREAIELIQVPTLVMMGRRSGCFPLEGMRETARRAKMARGGIVKESVFDAGHWLFYEEPQRFNREILDFFDTCEAWLEDEDARSD